MAEGMVPESERLAMNRIKLSALAAAIQLQQQREAESVPKSTYKQEAQDGSTSKLQLFGMDPEDVIPATRIIVRAACSLKPCIEQYGVELVKEICNKCFDKMTSVAAPVGREARVTREVFEAGLDRAQKAVHAILNSTEMGAEASENTENLYNAPSDEKTRNAKRQRTE